LKFGEVVAVVAQPVAATVIELLQVVVVVDILVKQLAVLLEDLLSILSVLAQAEWPCRLELAHYIGAATDKLVVVHLLLGLD
jgi:hypothetical protein